MKKSSYTYQPTTTEMPDEKFDFYGFYDEMSIQDIESFLDGIKIEIIEQYLRKKKLQNLDETEPKNESRT